MNQTIMTVAISKGLDGAIMNSLNQKMVANIITAGALSGRNNFCMNYLKASPASVLKKRACF
jgi:5-methyltetrahydrofolate--homocysteine methyltransferase